MRIKSIASSEAEETLIKLGYEQSRNSLICQIMLSIYIPLKFICLYKYLGHKFDT